MLEWTDTQQQAFLSLKAIMVRDCLCHYPDHNLPFDIYTDASDYQLGAVIMQRGRPVAYYSQKLLPAQLKYTTMEKELLSIHETVKEFDSMLMGADLTVHTDHKNLTTFPSTNQRILRQTNYCEQFQPQYRHIPGEENYMADMISRLPIRQDLNLPQEEKSELTSHKITFDSFYSSSLFDCLHDPRIQDAFLNLPDVETFPLPLDYPTMRQQQLQDQQLQQRRWNNPMQFPNQNFHGTELMTHRNPDGNWKICLLTQTLQQIVSWYHESLAHCGATKLYYTIAQHFEHPKLKATTENTCRACDACQRNTVLGQQYGHLPEIQTQATPTQSEFTIKPQHTPACNSKTCGARDTPDQADADTTKEQSSWGRNFKTPSIDSESPTKRSQFAILKPTPFANDYTKPLPKHYASSYIIDHHKTYITSASSLTPPSPHHSIQYARPFIQQWALARERLLSTETCSTTYHSPLISPLYEKNDKQE